MTFIGELYGPGVIAPDDTSLPELAAFANRTRNRRYGHLNAYRTKFVVSRVESVRQAPATLPAPLGRTADTVVVVQRAELPRYPPMAWSAGITGEVVLELKVSNGKLTNVEIASGDRMLSDEALRNVKTWEFAAGTSDTFTTTFSFMVESVESRDTGASTAPRIELQLPERVRITASD